MVYWLHVVYGDGLFASSIDSLSFSFFVSASARCVKADVATANAPQPDSTRNKLIAILT